MQIITKTKLDKLFVLHQLSQDAVKSIGSNLTYSDLLHE